MSIPIAADGLKALFTDMGIFYVMFWYGNYDKKIS